MLVNYVALFVRTQILVLQSLLLITSAAVSQELQEIRKGIASNVDPTQLPIRDAMEVVFLPGDTFIKFHYNSVSFKDSSYQVAINPSELQYNDIQAALRVYVERLQDQMEVYQKKVDLEDTSKELLKKRDGRLIAEAIRSRHELDKDFIIAILSVISEDQYKSLMKVHFEKERGINGFLSPLAVYALDLDDDQVKKLSDLLADQEKRFKEIANQEDRGSKGAEILASSYRIKYSVLNMAQYQTFGRLAGFIGDSESVKDYVQRLDEKVLTGMMRSRPGVVAQLIQERIADQEKRKKDSKL